MLRKAVFPGKYIQGSEALAILPDLIRQHGGSGLVLASPSVMETILAAPDTDPGIKALPVVRFTGECSENELTRVAGLIQKQGAGVLVGMGGGKVIDTAKIAADRADIPVVVVPTIASTDAPCSGCAVVYTDQGVFESVQYQKANPAAVVVDLNVIARAPARFLVAGMGDALATWFEARSCHGTASPNECGGLSTLTGRHLSRLCFDTLIQYGALARTAVLCQAITPALERIVEANILLSGLGFESGGLASAHAIHNGLTALAQTHAFFHGEKVAFGVLAGLHLTDAGPEEMRSVYAFCMEVGLPVTLGDIGLGGIGRSMLFAAAQKACAPQESIHKEAGTITPEQVLDAMLAADAMGRALKTTNGGRCQADTATVR